MVGGIATHNGKFHCDEALACFILKRLNQFRDYTLLKEFNETMQTLGILDFNTRLSSAGLIYAHYGKQLIAEILGSSHDDKMVHILGYQTSGGLSGRVNHLNPYWNETDPKPDERFQQAIDCGICVVFLVY
ncbi:unnamed protein product [Cylicocyclus nassatus]|uniref:Metal-dependent protein hydrolase n=1 Tax=Cylicocyclus nassatus TaxID=53992 RepID=A0AA36GX39_CYLNA|nr:unnamed protein product [Cylicocyclus nassatus]